MLVRYLYLTYSSDCFCKVLIFSILQAVSNNFIKLKTSIMTFDITILTALAVNFEELFVASFFLFGVALWLWIGTFSIEDEKKWYRK